VAVHAALTAASAASQAGGDGRSKGQLMADLLVERVTGQATASAVPVEVQVVITDRALLSHDPTPAQIPGYGTVPAGWARDLIGQTPDRVWMRRLFTHPDDGTLVAMDSTRRLFDGGLRRFLVARDGTCRTPWCDAPIRHLDHVVDHASGGPTSGHDGKGTCERCNHQAAAGLARQTRTRAAAGCLAVAYRRHRHAHRPSVCLDGTTGDTRRATRSGQSARATP
jgi:hypothetical protein